MKLLTDCSTCLSKSPDLIILFVRVDPIASSSSRMYHPTAFLPTLEK